MSLSGPHGWAGQFVEGLLSDAERKTCWSLAERASHDDPQAMQRLLCKAVWDADAVRDGVRAWLVEQLSHPDAVLVTDETGFLKKGLCSVGLQRQYTGTAGRVENSQGGIHGLRVTGRAGDGRPPTLPAGDHLVRPTRPPRRRWRAGRRRVRYALYTWTFNKLQRDRDNGQPPENLAPADRWLAANTLPLSDVANPATIRKALDALTVRIDGGPAAAKTVARKRAVFYSALKYAVELGCLDAHPMDFIQWRAPKNVEQVDRKVVVNPQQARALVNAVRDRDPHLEGFFACMYYGALRPSKVIHLRADECELPEDGWGWLRLSGSTQQVGEDWSDSGTSVEDRELKHRAKKATRDVPACPELVSILRRHHQEHRRNSNGRMFNAAGAYLAPVSKSTYLRAWRQARTTALTPAQQRSPLAHRPYDLRHAAVSLWLNAGVPATQVAQWAGHIVHVLLKVYASCIDGQDDAARKRIEGALGPEEPGNADT